MSEKTENPWGSLNTPSSKQVSSRRVGSEYPYNFYFAKDSTRKYMLVFSLSRPVAKQEKIQLNGILVGNVLVGNAPSIVLALKNNADWAIFLKICLDLCNVASKSEEESKAVELFYNRLRYWQYFLKRGVEDTLSREEQVGLIGELLVLDRYLLSQYGALDSINFWTGADADVQDFFIGSKRVEVKTCSSPSKNEVYISSLQQLYDVTCPIFLVVAHLGISSSDTNDAFTLYSLANNISEQLRKENEQAYEFFIRKLAMVGMFLDGAYNDTFYIANKFKGFGVRDNFPRITPNNIKAGITKAKYVINLETCENYELPLNEVFRKE